MKMHRLLTTASLAGFLLSPAVLVAAEESPSPRRMNELTGFCRRRRLLGLILLVVELVCHSLLAGNRVQRSYAITDLGTLGGSSSGAADTKHRGEVVGSASTTGDSAIHAFLYSRGKMQDLGTLGGSASRAAVINNRGEVVGSASTTGDSATHAFLYSRGKMQDLNSLLAPNLGWI